MNQYIDELITEMYFDVTDLAAGNSFKDVGYDSKQEFFKEMKSKLEELQARLIKEAV